MGNSSKSKAASKPDNRPPGFPLFRHASGRWCKKVRGEFKYFGKVATDPDGDAALEQWLRDKDDLLAGRMPRAANDGLTVHELVNRFLSHKEALRDAGELAVRTYQDYFGVCSRLLAAFGKRRLVSDLASDDFEALRKSLRTKNGDSWGPVSINNEIGRVRVVFKYAHDAGLIASPVRYGPGFKRPNRKALRQARVDRGPRLFSAAQLLSVLGKADQPLKAMILLGINCGLGNMDCGRLQSKHLDLAGGWLNYARPKTAIDRRCPLWPETVAALNEAIAQRPTPKVDEAAELVFVTQRGNPWHALANKPIAHELEKVLTALELTGAGLSFYALRHTTETIGSAARDQVALDHIMGHAPHGNDMAAVYREGIDDARLLAVSNHIRAWLYPETVEAERKAAAKATKKVAAKGGKSAPKRTKKASGRPEGVLLRLFG